MKFASKTHLVLIPSFNTGVDVLINTIKSARETWGPVWVVIDGSTDGSAHAALALSAADPDLRVLVRAANGGKGRALLEGLEGAQRAGFTHALTLDADGQHPIDRIGEFMAASKRQPLAMILGQPVFDDSAPPIRVAGRKIANRLAAWITRGAGIGDCLCGFRVYPIQELVRAMEATTGMRGFDFEPEASVRLSWAGVDAVPLPAPIRYFRPEDGGVSHFNYLRDNLVIGWMFMRLILRRFGVSSVQALRPRVRGAVWSRSLK